MTRRWTSTTSPANLFVADFVGNPSINFVEAKGGAAGRRRGGADRVPGRTQGNLPPQHAAGPCPSGSADRDAQAAAAGAGPSRSAAAERAMWRRATRTRLSATTSPRSTEEDDSLQDDPVLTNEDLVLGIRPEFLDIADERQPARARSTAPCPPAWSPPSRCASDDFLLTGVIFGSSLFTIGGEGACCPSPGTSIMLFHRKSGACIATGSLEAVKRLSRRKYLAEVFSPTHMSPGKPDQNLVHACGRQLRKAFSASRTTGSPMGLPVGSATVDSYFRITASSLSNAEAL